MRYLASAATAAGLACSAVVAGPALAIDGTYNTGRSEVATDESTTLDVRFHPCPHDGALVCGSIERVHNPTEPVETARLPNGEPVLGFTMIVGLEETSPGAFRGGRVNALDETLRKGRMKWYGVKIDEMSDDAIKVRGCLSFICPRSLVWRKIEG
ncbi:MAG: DUF2147 domain-containing protein [Parvularculaceae bacterium]